MWMRTTNEGFVMSPQLHAYAVARNFSATPTSYLRFQNALAFVDKVKDTFKNSPEIFNTFLDTMRDIKRRIITREQAIIIVRDLFEGHTDLILGFNVFLPPEDRLSVKELDERLASIFQKISENNTEAASTELVASMLDLELCKDPQQQYSMKMWFIEKNRLKALVRLLEVGGAGGEGDLALTESIIYGLKVLTTQQPTLRKRLFSHNDYRWCIRNVFKELDIIKILLKVLRSQKVDKESEKNIVSILCNVLEEQDGEKDVDEDCETTTNRMPKKQKREESAPQHTITWTDFGNFSKFFNNDLIPADVTLIVDERPILCHRIVLAARSMYFEKLFTNNMEERSKDVITIHDLSYDSTYKIIEYLYTEKIDISCTQEALQLCYDANFLQLPGLETKCACYLVDRLDGACIFEVWEVLFHVSAQRRYFQERCVLFLLSGWNDVGELASKVNILEEYFCRTSYFCK